MMCGEAACHRSCCPKPPIYTDSALDQGHLSELTLNLTSPSLALLLERELCACPSDFCRLQWFKTPAFTAAASVRRPPRRRPGAAVCALQ